MSKSKKSFTPEEAIVINGGLPLTQTLKFRHPDTGEYIDDVKKWQDDEGNWLPTKWDEQSKKFIVIASDAKNSAKESESK